MDQDVEKIEEDFKKKTASKKDKHKVSGRSVFKLREIIAKKAKKDLSERDTNKDS